MVTIKSYSDLQQSKKLAEFLPLESADIDKAFDEMDWVKLFRYLQNYLDEAQKGE